MTCPFFSKDNLFNIRGVGSTLENDHHFNLVDILPSPLFGADSRLRRHARMYTSLGMKEVIDPPRNLFLHAAEDAIVILVAATAEALVVVLIVRNALFALFHLDVSIQMDLVTSVALGLTRVMTRCQCTA